MCVNAPKCCDSHTRSEGEREENKGERIQHALSFVVYWKGHTKGAAAGERAGEWLTALSQIDHRILIVKQEFCQICFLKTEGLSQTIAYQVIERPVCLKRNERGLKFLSSAKCFCF